MHLGFNGSPFLRSIAPEEIFVRIPIPAASDDTSLPVRKSWRKACGDALVMMRW